MSSTSLEMVAQRGRGLRRLSGQLPTVLGRLRKDPLRFAMYVLARSSLVRNAHWLTARAAPPTTPRSTMFAGVTCESAVNALRREGLFTGLNIPKPLCDEIAAFTANTPCFVGQDRNLEFLPADHQAAEQRFNQAILIGNYFEKLLHCDAVVAVQQDPLLRNIAATYLGARTQITGTRIFWSFPTKRAFTADTSVTSKDEYHFDLLDWRMLKFFFYILPVAEGGGPHVFVRSSHRRRALRHQFTPFIGHPVDDVLKAYGADKPVTLLGSAGFGFVEDPFGFHMAKLAERAPRLVMEVSYGVSPPVARGFYG